MRELRHRPDDEEHERLLVVPRTPGPLIDPDGRSKQRVPDEIDELISDLFGPEPEASPGRVDVILLVLGVALAVSGQVVLDSGVVTAVGAVMAVLGSILPIRSAWRRMKRMLLARRRRAATARGRVLNVGHPLTQDLAEAYEALLAAVAGSTVPFRNEALYAAHLAVFESASLLAGDVPSTTAEATFLEKRIDAITTLTRAVGDFEAPEATVDAEREERALERAARARASEELESMGMSSLNELRELTSILKANERGRAV